jgi:hypothetical protein
MRGCLRLTTARVISDRFGGAEAARALEKLIPVLPHEMREETAIEALALVRASWTDDAVNERLASICDRGSIQSIISDLCKLAAKLPEIWRKTVIVEALNKASAIADHEARIWATVGLVPHLDPLMRDSVAAEAIAAAHSLVNSSLTDSADDMKWRMSGAMGSELATGPLPTVDTTWDKRLHIKVPVQLAPYLQKFRHEEVMAEALATFRSGDIAKNYVLFLEYLPEGLCHDMTERLLTNLCDLDDIEAINRLAQHLPETFHRKALAAVSKPRPVWEA